MKSSLAEIHVETIKYFYTLFNSVNIDNWKNSNQVFYCPVATLEDATRLLMKRDKAPGTNKNIKFPFATLTRGDFDNTDDLSRRSFDSEFVVDGADGVDSHESYKVLGVKILYDLVIYDDSLDGIEQISETLMFLRSAITKHSYLSNVEGILEVESDLHIVHSELPQYDAIPAHDDLKRGKGSIYSLKYPFRVDGAISVQLS